MSCVVVLVAVNGELYRFEGFCVGRLPERIVESISIPCLLYAQVNVQRTAL